MKKVILLSVSLGLALVSCSKNELTPVAGNNGVISFDTAISKASTKAIVNGTAYPTTLNFGTVAYKIGTTTDLYIPVSEVSFNSTDKYWSTATPYYWPKNDGLTFYSYSPYSYQEATAGDVAVTASETGLKFTQYDVAAHQQTDLMVAEPQKNIKIADKVTVSDWKAGVKTVFHHKLAQVVKINFATTETASPVYPTNIKDFANGHDGTAAKPYVAGDKVFIINSVKFLNIYQKANLTCTSTTSTGWDTDGWDNHMSKADFVWHNNASKNPFENGKYETVCDENGYRLVLPQTMSNGESADQQLTINYTIRTYTDATTYAEETVESSIKIHNLGDWQMNKKYTYTVWFNLLNDRIYWAPTVVDWEDATGTATI